MNAYDVHTVYPILTPINTIILWPKYGSPVKFEHGARFIERNRRWNRILKSWDLTIAITAHDPYLGEYTSQNMVTYCANEMNFEAVAS